MKITIDTNDYIEDVLNKIVVKHLKESLELIEGPQVTPIFSFDDEEEEKEVKKIKKAIKKVLWWYGGVDSE